LCSSARFIASSSVRVTTPPVRVPAGTPPRKTLEVAVDVRRRGGDWSWAAAVGMAITEEVNRNAKTGRPFTNVPFLRSRRTAKPLEYYAAAVRLKSAAMYETVRLKADTTYETVRLKADTTYETVRLKADATYETPCRT
jgi:hypothetical protein